jgi:diguanylate cyclase (GGDEF)-like protein
MRPGICTGLYNRRRLDEELERDLRRAERTGEPLSLLILDLDHFKQFNDISGHVDGDRLLKEVASRWTAELRRGDVLARFGGEEFVVLMPACPIDRAVQVADRLRALTPGRQTASAGAAH